MCKLPIDYSRTVIYKIVCLDLSVTDIYVGSTTEFRKRKSAHKRDCLTKNIKLYTTIRAQGGWENWQMVEVEKYPCLDSNEARSRERFWYENLKANLNMVRPIASEEEKKEQSKAYKKDYYIINADKFKEYQSDNADKIKAYKKDYKIINADKISQQHKEYRAVNADKISQQRKEYYIENADKILQQQREKRALNKLIC